MSCAEECVKKQWGPVLCCKVLCHFVINHTSFCGSPAVLNHKLPQVLTFLLPLRRCIAPAARRTEGGSCRQQRHFVTRAVAAAGCRKLCAVDRMAQQLI